MLARVENPKKIIIDLGQADINGAHKNKTIQYDIYHQNCHFHIGKFQIRNTREIPKYTKEIEQFLIFQIKDMYQNDLLSTVELQVGW